MIEDNLLQRGGPILRDGVFLRDLFDFEARSVAARVFNDPELYRIELEQVFSRAWIGVAHGSEIPSAGDFVLRHMGRDKVIVTRLDDGKISVLLNTCAHRAMQVCWADKGNVEAFRCPYHGFIYGRDGRLLNLPFEKNVYGDWDRSDVGLRSARVEVRNGIVFANFDATAPSLDEYFGDFAWYLDEIFGWTEWEALGPPIRFVVPVNWKICFDNLVGDLYHIPQLHRAVIDLGMFPPDGVRDIVDVVKVAFAPYGHSVKTGSDTAANSASQAQDEVPDEEARHRWEGRFYDWQLFPSTWGYMNANKKQPMPDGSVLTAAVLSNVIPRGPEEFEYWQLNLVPRGTPSELRSISQKMNSGILSQIVIDDLAGWPQLQHSVQGPLARQQAMIYNATQSTNKPDGWPGSGDVRAGYTKDDNQWEFWLGWFRAMSAQER